MKKLAVLLVWVSCAFAQSTYWVGTWADAAAPQIEPERMRAQHLELSNATVRQVVHLSLGGNSIRVRLSNAFSDKPIDIGDARVALFASGSSVQPGSSHALTFSGRASFQIPPGAVVISDPVALKVPNLGDLAISLFVPKTSLAGGIHYAAHATAFIAQGNVAAADSLADPVAIKSWMLLGGVDVLAPASTGAVVAFGDSITDGTASTDDANRRWPNVLAARLVSRGLAVLDLGIGGNRILHEGAASKRVEAGVNALSRFDRDVLAQPGVKYVVMLEGINDIGHPGSSAPVDEAVTAQDLIAGVTQVIERAHERGIKVIAGTVTPFESQANKTRGYFTPEKEKIRLEFNEWIRTTKALDGFIDFEKVVRDPEHPNVILKAFDSGDGLHPSDAGYKAMGEAVPLTLFRVVVPRSVGRAAR